MKTSVQCLGCAFYHDEGEYQQCEALKTLQHPGNASCKFYKTPEELRIGRQLAYERLNEKGLYSLIDYYGVRPEMEAKS